MRPVAWFVLAYSLINIIGYAMADVQGTSRHSIDQLFGNVTPETEFIAPNLLPCEGYLTAQPIESFCSETVPDDWTAFDFNDERLYVVPLNTPPTGKTAL
jgi:hypothetical protein